MNRAERRRAMKQAKRRASVRRHEEARQFELGIAQLNRVTAELKRTAEALAATEALESRVNDL